MYTLNTYSHKTGSSFAAVFVLTEQLFRMIQVFYALYRPLLLVADGKTNILFSLSRCSTAAAVAGSKVNHELRFA